MKIDYEGLKNKDIYAILDGDTEVAEYEGKSTVCRTIRLAV